MNSSAPTADHPSFSDATSPEPSEQQTESGNSLMLSPEMLEQAGMGDMNEGDTWTATIKFRKTGDGQFIPTAVMDAKMAGPEGEENNLNTDDAPTPDEDTAEGEDRVNDKGPRFRRVGKTKGPNEMGLAKSGNPVAM